MSDRAAPVRVSVYLDRRLLKGVAIEIGRAHV